MKHIKENNEDPNPKSNIDGTPLHNAAENGHFEICKLILDEITEKNPANIDEIGGDTPLHIAAKNNQLEICKLIMNYTVESNEDKNPTNFFGLTPIDVADQEGHEEVYKFLKSFQDIPKHRSKRLRIL